MSPQDEAEAAATATPPLPDQPLPDLTGIALTTGRLILKAMELQDIDVVTAVCQDPEIQKWTTVPSPYTRADAESYITKIAPAGRAAGTDAVFGLYHATTGDFLGVVGLHGISAASATRSAQAEIGYWLAPAARGHGYITEAVQAACRWAFAVLELDRIGWFAFAPNEASRKVVLRAGFTMEGTWRSKHVHRGQIVDTWIGSLLPGDRP